MKSCHSMNYGPISAFRENYWVMLTSVSPCLRKSFQDTSYLHICGILDTFLACLSQVKQSMKLTVAAKECFLLSTAKGRVEDVMHSERIVSCLL